MTSNSPSGILWMAICLGMATNTMCEPLRARGVEVVYGYSQSVTFDGDYCYEETFWDNMYAGKNVKDSIAAMKSKWGNWDGSSQIGNANGWTSNEICYNISEAQQYYYAFPIVVSDEDAHPGQRTKTFYGADNLQTVKSTYTLFSQYDVTAKTNNSAYGTVSVSGNVITATPKTGYFAQGYTVLSGSATVTQNGNSFSVMASSDCTVQINFALKTPVTVSFSGANVASQNGYRGDAMTLPTATAPEGFTFIGWMTSPMTQDSTEKPAHYTTSFTPTASTTLYALYSFVEKDSGTGSGDYVKVTSTPEDWSGEYLIVYEEDGYIFDSTLTKMDAVSNYRSVTIKNNTISAAQGDSYKFVIEEYNGGYSIKSASGLYVGRNDNTNGLIAGNTQLKNTISLDAAGNANIIASGGAYLRYNATAGQYRFRYYKSSTYSSQQPIALYVKDGTLGTTWFTGSPVKCEHKNTVNTAAVAATCTEGGYTAGKYCNDCSQYIEGHVAVAALGHSYTSVVTPPTTTEQGYTTYSCIRCDAVYIADFVDALGETYTVSFCVPTGVTAVGDMDCGKNGITLPTAAAPAGYTFVGWTATAVADTETAPTIYTGTYKATADTTLYALYTYTVGGTGKAGYNLIDANDLEAGDIVVITSAKGSTVYALPNGAVSKNPQAQIITVKDGQISSTVSDSQLWIVGGAEGAWTFTSYANNANKLFCNNANTGVAVGTGSNNTFKINGDYLYNTGTSRYMGVYTVNPDWRCYTSVNTNITGQVLGFYVEGQAGTTYYTTLDAQPEPEIEKFDIDVARMILGNALEFQFGVSTTKIPDKTGYYAVIEKTWADGTISQKTIPASEWGKSGNYHAVIYDGLAAKEMADTFYVTIYNAKGEAVSNPKQDAVRDYVSRAYASQTATGKTMMVDMLCYGAAAQVHFKYGTSDLANSKLTDAQKAVGTAATPEMSNDQVKGTNYSGSRFILESRIQVQLAFKNLTSDMYAVYTYINAGGKVQTVCVEGEDFVIIGGKPAGVELSALVYADARSLVSVTVYNADGTVHGTATDSIESCAMRSNAELFVALMKFADSAKKHIYG